MRSWQVYDSRLEVAEMAAAAIADAVNNSSGVFTIALSGGSTPETVYELLAGKYAKAIDWQRVRLVVGDERYVPLDHPSSNTRMINELLVAPLGGALGEFMTIDMELDWDECADDYDQRLQSVELDLVLLGMGADGHTASLFPSHYRPDDTRRVVTGYAPVSPHQRISLSLSCINTAKQVMYLVTGGDKACMVCDVLTSEPRVDYPGSMVQPNGNCVWYLDRAAASELPPSP